MKKVLFVALIALISFATAQAGAPIRCIKMKNGGKDGYRNVEARSRWNGWHIHCENPGQQNCFRFAGMHAGDPREASLIQMAESAIASGQFTGSISLDGITAHWSGTEGNIEINFSGE